MPNYQYSNPRGYDVGFVSEGIYCTDRYYDKNHIFKHKKEFNGVFIDNAIAIGKTILDDLIGKRVLFVEVTIHGIEAESFAKYISTSMIKEKGQLVNFDKKDIHNQNITGWGDQYIFSYEWGSFTKPSKELMQYE